METQRGTKLETIIYVWKENKEIKSEKHRET
jgi:hypothetical protein